MKTRIYLDNAATSWPKPESVYAAVDQYQRSVGAPAGRGTYPEAMKVMRLIDQTRGQVARLLNVDLADYVVVFSYSGTDSMTTGLLGLLKSGDRVVTTAADHNSVLRPLYFLEQNRNVQVTHVDCDDEGVVDVDRMLETITSETQMVVMTHVSNVTGAIQPVEVIGQHCQERGVIFFLDAAQSLGHLPVDMRAIGCDLLGAPGHKGLLAPLGTGLLCCKRHIADQITPLRFGGTAISSSADRQPTAVPDKLESGNLNVPGLIGLQAGLSYLASDQWQQHHANWEQLSRTLLTGLVNIDGLRLHGPIESSRRTGVFSCSIGDQNSREIAAILDSAFGIQIRSGLQCAPLLHQAIGTDLNDGTVRISPGLFNTAEEIQITLDALSEIAEQF